MSESNEAQPAPSQQNLVPWLLIGLCLAMTVLILHSRGMLWWCRWDSPLWLLSLDAWSKHNSQHLLDPYSLSHFQHGLIFFWFFYGLLRKKLSLPWLLALAVVVECGWELLENSPLIIDKYRANTASLEYYGDSILNAFGDILACILGFWMASQIKTRYSIALFVAIEILMLLTIRDSLLINILMLTFPLEAIKVWQTSSLLHLQLS